MHPDEGFGMVKLTPPQQQTFVTSEPDVFSPVKGAWGGRGATAVTLESADKVSVRNALLMAWRNVAPKALAASLDSSK
jgi:hypothetical protein